MAESAERALTDACLIRYYIRVADSESASPLLTRSYTERALESILTVRATEWKSPVEPVYSPVFFSLALFVGMTILLAIGRHLGLRRHLDTEAGRREGLRSLPVHRPSRT